MTVSSRPYVQFDCNERIAYICNGSYAGTFIEDVWQEAFQLGWRETEKGHVCPNCRRFKIRHALKNKEQLPETD